MDSSANKDKEILPTDNSTREFLLNDGEADSTDVSNQDELDSHTESDTENETDEMPCLTDSSNCECECLCCSNVSTPYHPVKLSDSKKTQLYLSECGSKKSHSRMIQSRWYELHPWISVCTSKYFVQLA